MNLPFKKTQRRGLTASQLPSSSSSNMRILIATVTAGAGHLQAAAALEEAWRELRPRDSVQRLDVLDFTPRLYRKVYVEGYVQLVEHAPELWAHVFKKTDNPQLIRRLARFRRKIGRASCR